MVVFRSILVPLKAAIMNLLSIGAAYGVIVAVFQWGWGRSLIGLDEAVPIVAFVPLMMFAILFGLSMDYEVFLLSRIREEFLRTGDSRESVATGVAKTARVITAAALIMISVFLGFVITPNPTVKMMGIGMAAAVLVDATIVRLLLVPATMELLGAANWWLPKWLDRVLPHLDLEGSADTDVAPAAAAARIRVTGASVEVPAPPDRARTRISPVVDRLIAGRRSCGRIDGPPSSGRPASDSDAERPLDRTDRRIRATPSTTSCSWAVHLRARGSRARSVSLGHAQPAARKVCAMGAATRPPTPPPSTSTANARSSRKPMNQAWVFGGVSVPNSAVPVLPAIC